MSDNQVAASITQMDYKTLQWLVLDLRDMLVLDDGESLKHAVQSLMADRAALAAQGEPVGEVFTMEALGTTPGKPFCHVLLNRTLPTGTKLYTAPPAPAKPMTDEQVTAAAKYLCNEFAADCNVDCDDAWMIHGEEFKESARRALMAAHGITDKGGA